ncbi:carbohydrate ABC transporter permease [Vagococcus lutrae]|uniref:carbohydrate ABC transporter permease n=1 Tax=Vagococcus lutrae TaxID=81947 RepID=UPI00200F5E20|nr:sugar ABC transporter permease [Vagococcus lutrae]MDT2800901.1 sugar ABC transporter permease [Vagococcus lutrae]MDT2805188.1 sugar ABC transporter permease [Vagococcus lutrae]MDT2813223.1 sugar ABC transporter permease [Vagococcus lutrae]MDT2824066.1 sugar ABC transporter permease [Vagococcus lutrae]MDT2826705.1 sugar ABC transporter permease [Vagococcus lutrae]
MSEKKTWFYLFITPVLIGLFSVVILPLIFGIYYSFTNWDGVTISEFVGFQNYLNVFKDKGFTDALWFTTKFSIVAIILINIIGLGLALLVTQKFKGNNLLRTIFFMPNLIGGLILGFIWQFVFTKAFASIGTALGIESLKVWLSTTQTGFWALVIVMCWQMSGYIMVIYISYLQSVDESLIEAASLDGANEWQKFWKIKFPMIMPGFTVSLFMTLSNSFKLYDQNLSLTGGGPYNSTQMVAMNIFNTAFAQNKMGYAQAKAIVFFVIIAVISLTQVYITKKKEVEV